MKSIDKACQEVSTGLIVIHCSHDQPDPAGQTCQAGQVVGHMTNHIQHNGLDITGQILGHMTNQIQHNNGLDITGQVLGHMTSQIQHDNLS